MHIDSTFEVVAPIDQVWGTLMDFERVAGCVPGARILNKLSEDAYQVGMTVKLGPVDMQYKGLLNVVERNAAEHRAVLSGKAQETRGQGTAEATLTLLLTEDGGPTRGTVTADLALSGKAAAMGKAVIGSVTEQMMSVFAKNLQAMLAEPAREPALVSESASETSAAPPPAEAPVAGAVAGSAPLPTSELTRPVPIGCPSGHQRGGSARERQPGRVGPRQGRRRRSALEPRQALRRRGRRGVPRLLGRPAVGVPDAPALRQALRTAHA